jgi:hypothetical protein
MTYVHTFNAKYYNVFLNFQRHFNNPKFFCKFKMAQNTTVTVCNVVYLFLLVGGWAGGGDNISVIHLSYVAVNASNEMNFPFFQNI